MGENIEPKKNEPENKPADEKKDDAPVTEVVLKLDLHCQGCAKKVKRSVSNLQGVEKVKADFDTKKLTVTGNVDPVWLREKVESKTKKTVVLISPKPKQDGGSGGNEKKADEKGEEKKEDKKPIEVVVSTVVMKIRLHCDGCANKIKRVILKNVDGVNSVTTDLPNNLVKTTGTMNVNELKTYLEGKLQRSVEVVTPKKAEDNTQEKKEKEGGDDKKEKEGGGGTGTGGEEKKEKESAATGGDGGEKKEKASEGGSSGEKKEGDGDKKESETKVLSDGAEGSKGDKGTTVELVNKMEHHSSTYNPQTHYAMTMYNQAYDNQGYGVPMYHHQQSYYNTGHVVQYAHEPPPPPPTYVNMNDNMFSDENPNGCVVM